MPDLDLKDRKRATREDHLGGDRFAQRHHSGPGALKNEAEINSKTREKIQSVAARSNYHPRPPGEACSTGRALAVRLILDQKQVKLHRFRAAHPSSRRRAGGLWRDGAQSRRAAAAPQRAADRVGALPRRYGAGIDGLVSSRTLRRMTSACAYSARPQHALAVTHGCSEFPVQHAYYDFRNNCAFVKRSVERLSQKQCKRIAMIEATPTLTCAGHQAKGLPMVLDPIERRVL